MLDKFIQYHNKPIEVSIHKDKKPLVFILVSFKVDYVLSGDDDDTQTYPYYRGKVKLLSDINDNDFKELTTNFIENSIRQLLKIRMKLFSIYGECLVDL